MCTTDNFLQAAEFIFEEGVDGAFEASLLVGVNVTIAMLSLQMGDAGKRAQDTLQSAGLLSRTHVTQDGNRAVIYNQHGKPITALEIKGDKCTEIPIEGLHINMWMSGTCAIKEVCAGNAPYTKLKQYMVKTYEDACEDLEKYIQQLKNK